MHVTRMFWIVTAAALMPVMGACSQSPEDREKSGKMDDHFTCASMIAAADQLMLGGKVPRDQELLERGLVASMTHLNAYAIPKGLDERTAFDTVKAERDRLIASLPASEIMARAKACAAQVPGQ